MDYKEQYKHRTSLYKGTFLDVYEDTVILPDTREASRIIVDHVGGAAVCAFTPEGQVILVKQYRYAAQTVTLEIPAGKKDARGEDGRLRAEMELAEETGYTSNRWVSLGSVMGAIGYGTEVVDLYAAFDCRLNGQGQRLDAGEFVDVVTLPLETFEAMIYNDEIIDGKTIIAFLKAQKKMSEFAGKVL